MWIIPKNLHTSLSVLDTEALTSDSEELSELFAQSLLARSKPSPAKTWSRRLKQGSLTLLPYGRILKPSLGQRFVDQWTSSLEASLASPSAPQVVDEETTTQDTFGPTSCEASDSWDTLPLFSSRTSRGSSAQSSQVTSGVTPQVRPFCTMSSVSWSAWVTLQRQEYSARARLASPISVNECSSWALDATSHTISVSGCHRSSEQESAEQRPPHQEALISTAGSPQESPESKWATPTARDHFEASMKTPLAPRKDGKHRVDLLPRQVHHQEAGWATPTTRDSKDAGLTQEARPMKDGTRRLNQLPRQALHQENYNGKLNPRWVETLMGLPVGWTMRSCATPWTTAPMNCVCLGTESSPLPLSERSECFGQGWPTPPASQRGETLEVYFRKSVDRMKQGGVPFAPTLQVSVEASALGIDPLSVVSSLKGQLHRDTEELVALCLGQGD